MLKKLYIRNFTLIDTLDIDFHPGFSVITGETGAGKSIILGAIGLLLGQRADSKMIKHGADKCVIEAHFDLSRYDMEDFFDVNDIEYYPTDSIIRRELTASGKSRAFINDTPAPLSLLKDLGERLVDVHSQHQNLLLNKQDFQLNVVDIIADSFKELAIYQHSYADYLAKEQQLAELKEEIKKNNDNADFLQFQYSELNNAALQRGEQEDLEQRAETMSHSEEIKSALYETDNLFSNENTGIVDNLKSAIGAMRSIGKVMPATDSLTQRMDSCYIELKDVSDEVCGLLDNVDFNPTELDAINNRLDKIYDLEKKYHCETIDELLAKQEDLRFKLNCIESSDDTLNELQQELDHKRAECLQHAESLSKKRTVAAKLIEKEMQKQLTSLGMPNVRFEINVEQVALRQDGFDKVAFLFCANKNMPLQPVAQTASGGEIARVMLSLKAMISGAVKLPTIIFDEIDTGVSGKIAEKMAHIMKQMGDNNRQVISITHLPQIAALGTTHYKVYKEDTSDGTISHMQMLSDNERITEIAQMLSGSDISEAAINNAKELLKL